MTAKGVADSPDRLARWAGALYLIIIVCGLWSELFVRASLFVPGDPATTAANVAAAQPLFRAGFAADVLMLVCDVAIAVLFYQLFRRVNQTLALAAAAFRLMQAAVVGAALLSFFAPLLLLDAPVATPGLSAGGAESLTYFFLELHAHGYDLGLVFFGVSSMVLGQLVVRSGLFPRLLGRGLQAAGGVYLVGSLTRFLAPAAFGLVQPLYLIPLVAEVAFCLWLLFKGAAKRAALSGKPPPLGDAQA